MISNILLLLGALSLASLTLLKAPKSLVKVAFCGLGLVMLTLAIYLFTHLFDRHEFVLNGFLFQSGFGGGGLENFFALIISFIGFVASFYSVEYKTKANLAAQLSLLSAFLLSMLLVVFSQDVFSFIVMWELMTLISAFLIKLNDTKESNKIVMIYLGIAQIGAFALLIALLIIAVNVGSYEFANWHNAGLTPLYSALVLVLLLIGFGSKAGLFPCHIWLPNAHTNSPSNVSALLSGVMLKVAVFGFVKFAFIVTIPQWFALLVIALGALGAVYGIAHAAVSEEFKKVAAYSSVENIALIFIAVGVALYGVSVKNELIFALGIVATLFHSLNHAIFKSLLFFAIGAVQMATGEKRFAAVGGLAHKMPLTAFFVCVGALAVCAAPPLNAFFSEWFLYRGLFEAAQTQSVLARLVFVLSLIAVAVVGALAVFAFIRFYGFLFTGALKNEEAHEKFPLVLTSLGVLAFLCVACGLGGNEIAAVCAKIGSNLLPNSNLTNLGELNFVLLFVLLVFLGFLPFSWFVALKSNSRKPRTTQPWANGFKYDAARLGGNASSFVGDLRRVLSRVTFLKIHFKQDDYFDKVSYTPTHEDPFWRKLYEPVVRLNLFCGEKIGAMQNGKSSFYVAYIVLYLMALLALTTQFLGA